MKRSMPFYAIAAALGALFPAPAGGEACGAGKALYEAKCSQCHGEKGDGNGVGADFFAPRPRDFASGTFKLRTTESGELPLDADLRRVIRKGMPYTGMPAWPDFSDQEVSDLICYVKSFNGDFADTSVHPKAVDIPKPPAFSEASAKAGRAVYEENKCMDCHGKWGRGDGESAPTLKDDWGHPIRPADLTKRWTFRGGAEREDIYRTFMTGLNGTPMPSFASSIKEEDRWKLVDYVYSLSTGSDPAYAGMVTAGPAAKLDPARLRESLAAAAPARFPVIGQVIEGTRAFAPACNAIEVRAAYDSDRVAVLVSWHDMSAQRSGANAPAPVAADSSARAAAPAAAPHAEETAPAKAGRAIKASAKGAKGKRAHDRGRAKGGKPDAQAAAAPPPAPAVPDSAAPAKPAEALSDAVALQLPMQAPAGAVKPYFLFGDRKHPVLLRFADLGSGRMRAYVGKGRGKLAPSGDPEPLDARYADGEWSVAFLLPRKPPANGGPALAPGDFMPIAFSVWDGLSGETAEKRGVTSWYSLYLEPARPHPARPAALHAAVALAAAAAGLFAARRLARKS